MTAEDTPEGVRVPVLWVGVDEMPLQTTNQLLAQVDRDHVYLVFGSATPPIVLGPGIDDIKSQVEGIGYVPVRPLARLAMSRRHLDEVIDVLQRAAQNYDRQGENS